ncbi:hypothetical protein [Salipiger thiooxidans]|uniref:hypothetical protein n=1 Tax=Salipiger thiooxidans TaxID=282683 RepID=UPI001CD5DAFE|nr:hypothetical protein [Salipiger thiooxidans]MCA0849770.1 hypothetical protein [Salipiger thiooxidans]
MKTQITILRQMGAARPYTERRPLEVVEADLDAPGPGELLVRMQVSPSRLICPRQSVRRHLS